MIFVYSPYENFRRGGEKGPRLDFQACVTLMYPKQTLVSL